MLLTIRQSGAGAQGLPILLHRDPDTMQEIEIPSGKVKVFFPEYSPQLVEAALLLEPDILSKARPDVPFMSYELPISQYVHGYSYRSPALMALALAKAFPEALEGTCKEDPDAVDRPLDLEISISAVGGADDEEFLHEVLALSGYEATVEQIPLASDHTEWGNGPACHVQLKGRSTLSWILRRLYAILATLEEEKDHWIGHDEVEAMWKNVCDWLDEEEMEKVEPLFFRANAYRFNLALKRLGDVEDPGYEFARAEEEEALLEGGIGLQKARREAIFAVLKQSKARTVLDLNCGHGQLVGMLIRDSQFTKVGGLDIDFGNLHITAENLNTDDISPEEGAKLILFPGSPIYRDERTEGYDAVVLADWMEHLPPNRLPGLEMSIFRYMKPGMALITTPNAEYNSLLENLPSGQRRHAFHQFEWTRAEFKTWAEKVAASYGYRHEVLPVGPEDPKAGPPTLLAVFTKTES